MATQEIKSTDWKAFCEKFLQLHRGTLMNVVQINPAGQKVEVVSDMPLTKVWFESGGCNDRLFLDFEQDGKREVIHEVIQPIHLKIREEGEGRKGLQIDAENGSTMVLFRSGKLDQLLGDFQTV